MVDSLKKSAIQYAKAGLRVFPLVPNSKGKQVLKSWKSEATTDIEQINTWWNKNPNYNIGIATGNGLLIIDIDVKKGAKGLESLKKYGDNLPITAKVKTPSGGYHLYYNVDGDFKNRVNIYPGIDIRSNNGYVVASPSQIDGQYYEWVNNEPIAVADQEVYKFLNGPDIEAKETQLHIDNEITQGSRNDILFKLASSLQSKGLSNEAILSSVLTENSIKCNPPLDFEEVKTIVDSALKYDKGTSPYKEPKKKLSLEMTSMADVEEKEAQWLIPLFIPKGVITVVAGDGGVGKTFMWCDLVASVSSGTYTFFEYENNSLIHPKQPQKVMYFSSEDDMQVTLKKRLRLSGANMDNIITIPISDERFQEVQYNSEFLEELIAYHKPALVVFDPLQGFIPNNVNMGYRNQMRNVLKPLNGYGEKYGVTTVIVCHTNKKSDTSARGRVSDSSDIWDIARSVFIIGHTGSDDLRYLSHEKCNYGPLQDTTLFSIDDGVITNRGTTDKKDKDFMSNKSYDRKNKGAKDEAKEFILDQLKEHGGSMENKDLLEYAKACGYSQTTIDRAKKDLKKDNLISIDVNGKGKERVSNISLIPKEV